MFNTTDLTKLFDPQQVTKNMQQLFDFNSAASTSKQNLESFKQLSTIWADTYSACCEKQLKACQSTMEETVDCLRDLSSSKGVEDYVAKQTEWSKKFTEKAQSTSQEIAETVQKGQTKCNDIISTLVSQNTQQYGTQFATATTNVTNAANRFTQSTTGSNTTTSSKSASR